jgi:endonuclease/exonuclease/phosphatase family metal-dependent hydrolase
MMKLFSCNIEGSTHLQRLEPFVREYRPDVSCLQEVFESDLGKLSDWLGTNYHFTPLVKTDETPYPSMKGSGYWGIAVFVRGQATTFAEQYYVGDRTHIPNYVHGEPNSSFKALIEAKVDAYNFITTHFTWTAGGSVSDRQRQDLALLLPLLKEREPLIFCGDLNAPRGKWTFEEISKRYTDNIPAEYTSSIDPVLHRAAPLEFMVDALFSTPEYRLENVKLNQGVSDHMAITAEVSLA